MKHWPVQEAKSRFSELLDQSFTEGAQVITRHGRATAVLVPYAQWLALSSKQQRDLKAVLLDSSTPRMELELPRRGKLKLRTIQLGPDAS